MVCSKFSAQLPVVCDVQTRVAPGLCTCINWCPTMLHTYTNTLWPYSALLMSVLTTGIAAQLGHNRVPDNLCLGTAGKLCAVCGANCVSGVCNCVGGDRALAGRRESGLPSSAENLPGGPWSCAVYAVDHNCNWHCCWSGVIVEVLGEATSRSLACCWLPALLAFVSKRRVWHMALICLHAACRFVPACVGNPVTGTHPSGLARETAAAFAVMALTDSSFRD